MSSPHANHQGEPGDTGTGLTPGELLWICHGSMFERPSWQGQKWDQLPISEKARWSCVADGFLKERTKAASAPTAPDRVGEEVGRELEGLSKAATPGMAHAYMDKYRLRVGPEDSTFENEFTTVAVTSTCDKAGSNLVFLAALWNAYRSGKLVASTGGRDGGSQTGADWLDQPIGGELVFDGMRFGTGVPLRTVIKAAQRWRRDAMAAFNEKVETRKSDGGDRIPAGLEDALAWAQGDTSRGELITVKDGQIVDAADPSRAERDHVVSARLIPREPDSLGGVDLTFKSGLRVALPLSRPEPTPKSSPEQPPSDPQMTVDAIGARAQAMCAEHCDGAEGRKPCGEFTADQEHDWRADAEADLRLQAAGEVR